MKISKTELQDALEIVKPGLANKDIIEQATSFAFMENKIVTYNDEISISHPIEGLEIEGAIKADELYKLLSRMTKDEIDISIKGGELLLKSGKSKAGLILEAEINLPLEEIGDLGKWRTLPDNFIHFIKFAMGACSRDMSQGVLICVYVNKKGFIEASDRYKLIRCDLESKVPVKSFLIPASSAVELVKLNANEIAEGDGWIHFKTEEGTIISCRIFEDDYPDITEFLEVEGVELSLPRTLDKILDRASVFSKRDHLLDESVVITLGESPNKIKVRAESPTGWIEEEANIKYNDEPTTFSITPYLLKGILAETTTCILCENRLKFSGDGWEYVTVLKETIS